MAKATILKIVQDTAALLSIPKPLALFGSTDQQVVQLLALANEEGRDQASAYDWQKMRRQQVFTTTATPEQVGAVPDDWDRFIANSFFNRTQMRYMIGPITPQVWQATIAQPALNRIYLAFIERDGQFLVTPTPPAGQTIAYEYITTDWAVSSLGVPKAEFLADDDRTYLSDNLFRLGIRWRFLKSKGLEYAEDFRTYQTQLRQQAARDGGNTAVFTTGAGVYAWSDNIQSGNFPGPI